MSAFRQAVLSVNPERLEQFSREIKKNIKDKSKKRKWPKDESSKKRDSKSVRSSEKKKKRRKTTHISKGKKDDSKEQDVDKERSSRRSSKKSSRSHQHSSSRDGNRRCSKKAEEDSDMEKDGLDLSVPLAPLTDLVKDKTALLDTVFNIIKGPKLTSMLPDILKLMPMVKIKYLCREQLDVMSSKRLHHILAGKEMEFSSGTDSSDEEVKKLKETIRSSPSPVQDSGLQANFVDSTTSESANPLKLMLFPSAISTALTLATGSPIPIKEISNDNEEVDMVSTSTEPNFIYSGDGNEKEDEFYESSDPEEGEVTSSEGASDSSSEGNPDASQQDDFEEEVFVEEEELEEYDEIRSPRNKDNAQRKRSGCTSVKRAVERGTNTSEQMKKTVQESNEGDTTSKLPKEESDPYAGKSQLEILELEMRARAIRSLMKAAQSGKLNSTK